MENQFWNPVAKFIYGIIAFGGSAFGLGKYNGTIVKKKELYNEDGSLIYMTAESFDEKISAIGEKVSEISDYIIDKNKQDLEMHEFVGTVKQFMEERMK